jgi:glycosyltransferase involved in cell wall biosynthesis
VIPFYNVAGYLPMTLTSLERQSIGLHNLQVILVDDGSDDGSGEIAEQWSSNKPNATYIRQENSGPGAARNRGLEMAEGEWFASIDGDDIINRNYFENAAQLIARDKNKVAAAIIPRILVLKDETGRYHASHPLDHKHCFGDRLACLEDEPEAFALSSTTMMKTSILRSHDLKNDPRIVPTFEDAHLIGRYLATFDDPVVAIAASSRYYYRKRMTQGSLVQSSWSKPERFTVVPRYGYLDLLRKTVRPDGSVPRWAQYMVLYDLIWYLKDEQSPTSRSAWVKNEPEIRDEFLATLEEIMKYIEADVIRTFPCNKHPWEMRQALLMRFKEDGAFPRVFKRGVQGKNVVASLLAPSHGEMIKAYADGEEIPVLIDETREHSYYGSLFMVETMISWTADPAVNLSHDDNPVQLQPIFEPEWERPPKPRFTLSGTSINAGRSKIIHKLKQAYEVLNIASLSTNTSYAKTIVRLGSLYMASLKRRINNLQ